MKTKVVKILKIILLLFIISLVYSCKVQASEVVSFSATGCKVNENFTVNIGIPQDAIGYHGYLSIRYEGESNFEQLEILSKLQTTYTGNISNSYSARKAGTAEIKLESFELYNIEALDNVKPPDPDGKNKPEFPKMNNTTSFSTTIVIEGAPVTNPEPSNPTTPTTPDTPSTPTNPSEPTTLEFSDTNEKMYVSKAVNFRQNYTTNSGKIKTLEAGIEVTRLGVSKGTNEGYSWSRISYNGVTGYVITANLTYDKPEEEVPPEEPETPETPEEVDPNQEKISKISEELGAIPEVGLNIATFIFFGSSIVCVIMMVEVKRKIAK